MQVLIQVHREDPTRPHSPFPSLCYEENSHLILKNVD